VVSNPLKKPFGSVYLFDVKVWVKFENMKLKIAEAVRETLSLKLGKQTPTACYLHRSYLPRYGLDAQIFKQRQEVLEYKRQMGTLKARRQAGAGLQNAAGASSVLCIRLVDLVGED